MTSVVAVDLGKTGCRAMLWNSADSSRAVNSVAGAPGLAAPDGVTAARAAVRAAVEPLLREAGGARPESVLVGAAGRLRPPRPPDPWWVPFWRICPSGRLLSPATPSPPTPARSAAGRGWCSRSVPGPSPSASAPTGRTHASTAGARCSVTTAAAPGSARPGCARPCAPTTGGARTPCCWTPPPASSVTSNGCRRPSDGTAIRHVRPPRSPPRWPAPPTRGTPWHRRSSWTRPRTWPRPRSRRPVGSPRAASRCRRPSPVG